MRMTASFPRLETRNIFEETVNDASFTVKNCFKYSCGRKLNLLNKRACMMKKLPKLNKKKKKNYHQKSQNKKTLRYLNLLLLRKKKTQKERSTKDFFKLFFL